MEHALRASSWTAKGLAAVRGLNPYCNGTCSKRAPRRRVVVDDTEGLNPYCNGTCSKRDLEMLLSWSEVES